MTIPYHTHYSDYEKHQELTCLIRNSKHDIDDAYLDGTCIQDREKLADLLYHFYHLSTKLHQVEHAIDSVNYILMNFGDHFTDFSADDVTDAEDLKNTIDDIPLASLSINTKQLNDYKVKDLKSFLSQLPDQYLSVHAKIELSDIEHKSNTSYLLVTIFVKDALLSNMGH